MRGRQPARRNVNRGHANDRSGRRSPMHVLIVAVPPMRTLDVFGPAEVFGDANWLHGGIQRTKSTSFRPALIAWFRIISARLCIRIGRTTNIEGRSILCWLPDAWARGNCATNRDFWTGYEISADRLGGSAQSVLARLFWRRQAFSTGEERPRIGIGPVDLRKTTLA